MDSPKHIRVPLPALPQDMAIVQERPDEPQGPNGPIRKRVRRGLEHHGCSHQAGSIVVNFGIGSDRYASSFYHGPDSNAVDRCEC